MSLLKEITILREWFLITVNSHYCGHSRDRDLVSVLARVSNSGVREKKNVLAGFTVKAGAIIGYYGSWIKENTYTD